jgi:hypothetical protein
VALHLAREASDQTNHGRLTECIREQARSHRSPISLSSLSSLRLRLRLLAL